MKYLLAVLCLAAAALAIEQVVPIVSEENVVDHDGKFHYSYESGDGSKASEQGELKVFDAEHAAVVTKGQYTYTGDDGKQYTVTYTADENGYQPSGEHLPVAPPVPEPIARALAYLATIPQKST